MARTGVHVFRKDLRTEGNLALNELAARVDRVIGVFVFDQAQIKNSPHFSQKAAQFLIECVAHPNKQCGNKFVLLRGSPVAELRRLLEELDETPAALSFNSDFTPYAMKRDRAIVTMNERLGVKVIANTADQTLVPMSELLKQDGSPYMAFGPFFKWLQTRSVHRPSTRPSFAPVGARSRQETK
ncbi:hypothetical protein PR003_g17188 [Phytophthora rubi]|uniref:Photolyase/cryptochrome alpha/beta domain-containing protein n=1 Tax=Phytophthora rubi TaxID=129364 RepID=A0A6A3LWD5_9STRA|nr:hypothetical protein PR002_g12008 [Phytophthora rubi]KAE9028475.1 hypothetical protein PR001_g11731 [Phytophthora rubi]KAE9322611.1 hypothetical protein PR003_g17188 [Phytophthora rubi]